MDSLISQSFTNWECIIIDDGSMDKTEVIVKTYYQNDGRIKYFKQKNQGVSSARNSGTQKASGDFIFYLDSDDRFSDEKSLKKLIDASDLETDIIFADISNEFADGSTQPAKLSKPLLGKREFTENEILDIYLEEKIPVVVWNKLYRKGFLKDHNFKFHPEIIHGEDELWSLEVFLKAKKIKYVPEVTYNYYKGNATSITTVKTAKNYKSLILVMKRLVEIFGTNEKLKNADKKSLIRYFEKQYYFLKSKPALENKKLWKQSYNEVQNIYKQSILNNFQKRFVYNSHFSYFALKKIQNSPDKEGSFNKILSKLVTF